MTTRLKIVLALTWALGAAGIVLPFYVAAVVLGGGF